MQSSKILKKLLRAKKFDMQAYEDYLLTEVAKRLHALYIEADYEHHKWRECGLIEPCPLCDGCMADWKELDSEKQDFFKTRGRKLVHDVYMKEINTLINYIPGIELLG